MEQGDTSSDRLTPSLEAEDSNSNASDSRSVSSVSMHSFLRIKVTVLQILMYNQHMLDHNVLFFTILYSTWGKECVQLSKPAEKPLWRKRDPCMTTRDRGWRTRRIRYCVEEDNLIDIIEPNVLIVKTPCSNHAYLVWVAFKKTRRALDQMICEKCEVSSSLEIRKTY